MEMFVAPFPLTHIFCSVFDLREYVLILVTSTTETNFDFLVI